VLDLNGPAGTIDSVERALFLDGVIAMRMDTGDFGFSATAGRLDAWVERAVQSGLLALVVTPTEGDTLTANAENRHITLNSSEPSEAVRAVRQLLARAGILFHAGKAGSE
jgi:hypothetical protein